MKNKQQQKLNDKILKAANRKEIPQQLKTSLEMGTTTSKQNKGIKQISISNNSRTTISNV